MTRRERFLAVATLAAGGVAAWIYAPLFFGQRKKPPPSEVVETPAPNPSRTDTAFPGESPKETETVPPSRPAGRAEPTQADPVAGSFPRLPEAIPDPFLPIGPSSKQVRSPSDREAGVVLQGILAKGDKALAILNGEIYAQGDTVRGRAIESIRDDFVVIRRGNEVKALRIGEDDGAEK